MAPIYEYLTLTSTSMRTQGVYMTLFYALNYFK